MPRSRRRFLSVTALALAGGLLYLPSFATPRLHGEEARRAIPAREMIASGNYVLPTVWGQPYLNKPPLYFWMIAGVASLTGEVNELSTRLPSVLATILTAIVVYALGVSLFGERAGFFAGLLFLLCLNVIGKGALGEIEPALCLAVLSSIALLWWGRQGRWAALLGSGVLLGAALLLKGPVALLFFAGAGLAIAATGEGWRFLRSARLALPLALGIGLASIWVLLLVRQPDTQHAFGLWGAEMARSGGKSVPAAYGADRLAFVGAALGAFLPSSLLLALAVGTSSGRALAANPRARFLGIVLATGFGYFLLAPGVRPRYVYPAVPMACLLAAAWLDLALRGEGDRTALRRLRWCAAAVFAASLLIGAAGIAAPVHRIAGLDSPGAGGSLLLLAILGVSLSGLLRVRAGATRGILIHGLLILALLRAFRLVEISPQVEGPRDDLARMAELEEIIPPGETVGLHAGGLWNHLFYLRRPVRWVSGPGKVASGDLLVLDAPTAARFARELPLEELHRLETRGGRELAVFRLP